MNEHLFSYAERLRRFIEGAGAENFETLALDLFQFQRESNPAHKQLCAAGTYVSSWKDIPAVPTFAFKELELTSLPPTDRTRVFYSSGTTQADRSRHFHSPASLQLYEQSLLTWFKTNFEPRLNTRKLLILTPPAAETPNSSLSHMFQTIAEHHGGGSVFVGSSGAGGVWDIDFELLLASLDDAVASNKAVAILGTAFLFVNLLDEMDRRGISLNLPKGSWAIETGGYKGRSRVVPKQELRALIIARLGIASTEIFGEYGMSELSSQAYDRGDGVFRFPPWARVRIVSPETDREVADGERGLIRVYDLANVWSVMAVQTEDIGLKMGDGFELCGRAAKAEARGCSLMAA